MEGGGALPKSSGRGAKEWEEIFDRRVDMVWKICFAYMKNRTDVEDAVQNTFLQLIKADPVFENEEHEKAWLIRTASNICINTLKHWWRKREDIAGHEPELYEEAADTGEVWEAVRALPPKYRTVIYLRFVEGYSGEEIARILRKPSSTIRNQVRTARAMLRERLGDDYDEE